MYMVFELLISRRLIVKSFCRNQDNSRLNSELWRLYSDFRRLITEQKGWRLKNHAHV